MKAAVVIFHKNIDRYPENWVRQCVESIQNQTYRDFDVFEIDYGAGGNQIYPGSNFINEILPDHAQALNFLLKYVFDLGYDCAFNVNIDDYYDIHRFELQIKYIKQGYDIVSSNFNNVDEHGNIRSAMDMASKNIQREAIDNNNIIAHPVVCYSKRFKEKLRSEEIPRDDFELWRRCYDSNKYNFIILPQYLLFYRSHNQKTS